MITFRNLTDEKLSSLIEGYKFMKKNSRSEQFQRDLEEELRLAHCIEGNIASCGKEVQLASDTFDLESKFPGLIFLMRKADIKIATFDEMNEEQKEATNGWRGKDLNEAEEVFYISDDLNNSWQVLSQVLIETYTNYNLTSGFAEELKEGQTLYDLERPDSEIEGFASMLRLAVEEDSDLTVEDINGYGVYTNNQRLCQKFFELELGYLEKRNEILNEVKLSPYDICNIFKKGSRFWGDEVISNKLDAFNAAADVALTRGQVSSYLPIFSRILEEKLDTHSALKYYSDRFFDEVIAAHKQAFMSGQNITNPSYVIYSDSEKLALMEDFKMYVEVEPDSLNEIEKMGYEEFIATAQHYLSHLEDHYSWNEGYGPSMFIDHLKEDYPKVEKGQAPKVSSSTEHGR